MVFIGMFVWFELLCLVTVCHAWFDFQRSPSGRGRLGPQGRQESGFEARRPGRGKQGAACNREPSHLAKNSKLSGHALPGASDLSREKWRWDSRCSASNQQGAMLHIERQRSSWWPMIVTSHRLQGPGACRGKGESFRTLPLIKCHHLQHWRRSGYRSVCGIPAVLVRQARTVLGGRILI